MAGFDAVTIKSDSRGLVDLDDLRSKLDDQVGVFMITNPSTLGIVDDQVAEIADLVHQQGRLIYLDGANMNAILGIARPGDFGADMMHYNPNKTFSGPHGDGGPGAGPICISEKLGAYLPSPVVCQRDGRFALDYDRAKSIRRIRAFFGNVGVLVRAYCYIRTHGPDGLRQAAENAVLNANYQLSRVKHILPIPHADRCMHEFVATANELKRTKAISAMDISKRLLDFGYHAPTVYFPLTVPEAMMIEPIESESKETLDAFAEALFRITDEPVDPLHEAPLRWAGTAGGSALRFDQWNEPTFSLGYFQPHQGRDQHPPSAHLRMVRRATGGGAIVHDRELTYNFVTPIRNRFSSAVQDVVKLFQTTLIETLENYGIEAVLCGDAAVDRLVD